MYLLYYKSELLRALIWLIKRVMNSLRFLMSLFQLPSTEHILEFFQWLFVQQNFGLLKFSEDLYCVIPCVELPQSSFDLINA